MTTLNTTANQDGSLAVEGFRPGRFGALSEIMQTMAGLKRQTAVKVDLDIVGSSASLHRMRFTSAAMSGDITAMRAHLAQISSPDEPDPWGSTPLAFAVMVGNREGVEELLRMGADPLHRNRSGRSPLDNAVDAAPALPEIVELLQQSAGIRSAYQGERS